MQTGGPVDPANCALPEAEIHDLIRQRMECKFARDYRTADDIEARPSSKGVVFHDGVKEWRADGERWAGSRRAGGGGYDEAPRAPKAYVQRVTGAGRSEGTIAEIDALVAERSGAKAN